VPTASVDFTLATLAMIVVVMGAVFGVNMVVAPHLDSPHDVERYHQLGRYMLLSRGTPTDWGTGSTPTKLGFASGGEAYDLDIDKVTRLNSSNANSVSYATLWEALGADDVSFNIAVKPIFDVTLSETSSEIQGSDTVYTFTASTAKGGYPLPCQVSYYVAVRNSTYSSSGSTDSQGTGTVQFTLPNSEAGTALLVGIARAEESVVSYSVLPFAHSIGSPHQPGAYATLSPLNHTLSYSLTGGGSAWNAAVFTYAYSFNLTASGSDFTIPLLLDPSPMVVTLTGVDGSDHWAEWAAYPQVPLETGADMDDDYVVSDVYLATYVVEINGALYRFEIKFRSPAEYD